MNRTLRAIAITSLTAGALMLASSVQAGTVSVTWTGGPGVTVQLGATTIGTAAGDFLVDPDLVGGLSGDPFYTFCVDLQHYSQNTTVEATLSQMSSWNLYASTTAAAKAKASSVYNAYPNKYAPPASNDTAAAYQLAIWELLYETDATYSLTAGNIKFSGAAMTTGIVSLANTLIENSSPTADTGWLITANSGSYFQDFMAPCETCGVTVPDPLSSLAALGLGLLSLGSLKRRLGK